MKYYHFLALFVTVYISKIHAKTRRIKDQYKTRRGESSLLQNVAFSQDRLIPKMADLIRSWEDRKME